MIVPTTKITDALNTADIEGFIALGAPHDEYSNEANSIGAALNHLPEGKSSATDITAVIALVWQQAFQLSDADIAKRLASFRHVAAQLLNGHT